MQPNLDLPHSREPAITETKLGIYLRERAAHGRLLVALAGPPAAGKSTLAATLQNKLGPLATRVPLDGFHYDDRVLAELGLQDRKGSPPSFDADGFHHLLARLRYNGEESIAVPLFDRELEISRAGARLIPKETRIILVEGNYLLLDQLPWRSMQQLYDISVMVSAPQATLRKRLEKRWQHLDAKQRAGKIQGNDLPNAELVKRLSSLASFRLFAH